MTDAATVAVDVGAVARVGALLGEVVGPDAAVQEGLAWDDPLFWNVEGTRRERCQYLAVGNALNFRFWSLVDGEVRPATGSADGDHLRGAMYMWRRLRLATQQGLLDLRASSLAELDESTFRRAFADDDGRVPLAVAIDDRLENLRDLGRRLQQDWDGWFEHVVDAADGSLQRFAELSQKFRAWDDPVQKLTMLNALMLQGSGLVQFDADPLPAIDYHLVKQACRQGLVEVPPSLEAKLRAGELLDAAESLGLRVAVLEALEGVAARSGVRTTVLDNVYWSNRSTCSDREPDCEHCSFKPACAQRTELGLPLELTRYY